MLQKTGLVGGLMTATCFIFHLQIYRLTKISMSESLQKDCNQIQCELLSHATKLLIIIVY